MMVNSSVHQSDTDCTEDYEFVVLLNNSSKSIHNLSYSSDMDSPSKMEGGRVVIGLRMLSHGSDQCYLADHCPRKSCYKH